MISVIVPIYNVEEYLPTCINSILNQTYKDIEILLIDDGSTDDSGRICDEYAKQDNRCIVIHQQHKGVSETRNTGLNHATGEYISFIDGDDYIHPQMLEILYEALQKGNYDFSMTLYKEVHTKEQFRFISHYTSQEIYQEQLIYGLYNYSLKNNSYPEINFYVIWNKLYKKELVTNIFFIQTASEDIVFNNTIYLKVQKAIIINETLYYWVQRHNSITRRNVNETYINRILSYYQCLTNIPEYSSVYRTAALERLYKSLVSFRFYVKNPYLKIKFKEIKSYIIENTFLKFLLDRNMSTLKKITILMPLYVPFIFKIYIRFYSIKNKFLDT